MEKFSSRKEKPLMIMPPEIVKLLWLETLPTLIVWSSNITLQIFPNKTLRAWPGWITIGLSHNWVKNWTALSMTLINSVFGVITHQLCSLILSMLLLKDNHFNLCLMKLGEQSNLFPKYSKEVLKSSMQEGFPQQLVLETLLLITWEIGFWEQVESGLPWGSTVEENMELKKDLFFLFQ